MLRCGLFFRFDGTCDSDLLSHDIYLIHFSVSIDDHNTNFMSLSYSDHVVNVHKKLLMIHRMHMVCTQENDKESRIGLDIPTHVGRVKKLIQNAFRFSICSLICGVVCLRSLGRVEMLFLIGHLRLRSIKPHCIEVSSCGPSPTLKDIGRSVHHPPFTRSVQ